MALFSLPKPNNRRRGGKQKIASRCRARWNRPSGSLLSGHPSAEQSSVMKRREQISSISALLVFNCCIICLHGMKIGRDARSMGVSYVCLFPCHRRPGFEAPNLHLLFAVGQGTDHLGSKCRYWRSRRRVLCIGWKSVLARSPNLQSSISDYSEPWTSLHLRKQVLSYCHVLGRLFWVFFFLLSLILWWEFQYSLKRPELILVMDE